MQFINGCLGGHPDAMDTLPFDVYDSVPMTAIVDNNDAQNPSHEEPVDEILRAPTLKLGDSVDETEGLGVPTPPEAEPAEPAGVVDVPTSEDVSVKQSGACVGSGTPGFDAINHQAFGWNQRRGLSSLLPRLPRIQRMRIKNPEGAGAKTGNQADQKVMKRGQIWLAAHGCLQDEERHPSLFAAYTLQASGSLVELFYDLPWSTEDAWQDARLTECMFYLRRSKLVDVPILVEDSQPTGLLSEKLSWEQPVSDCSLFDQTTVIIELYGCCNAWPGDGSREPEYNPEMWPDNQLGLEENEVAETEVVATPGSPVPSMADSWMGPPIPSEKDLSPEHDEPPTPQSSQPKQVEPEPTALFSSTLLARELLIEEFVV
eukprot:s428_g4.t1